MQIDLEMSRAVTPGSRRGARRPWAQLLSAVLELAGTSAELLRHAERPWSSVTFSGTRHTIALTFAGTDGIAAGERFLDALPEHEFTLPRQIVADAAVLSAEQEMVPHARLAVEIELLLVEDF